MALGSSFQAKSGVQALLDQIYEIKFSKHVPLSVVLLSGIYAVYRSTHYLVNAFHLDILIAIPTAIFIELLVLAAGALVFLAHRNAFIAELKDEDEDIAQWGVWMSLTLLGVAFAALIGIAWADAWLMTETYVPSALMALAQIAQSGFIVSFVIMALLDERSKLRGEYADYERQRVQRLASECPYCHLPVSSNNRKRHEARCPARKQP